MDRLRAPFHWFGGKGGLISKLLPVVPAGGKPYCEPYCGAASVFFAREPAPVEVLNDLDGNIVNFFRVLQNRQTFEELRHRLAYTPYARAEFAKSIELLNSENVDEVTRAWAFFVSQNQTFAGLSPRTVGHWGRVFVSAAGMAGTVNNWIMRLSMLDAFRWRIMHAQIDNRDALDVIRYWDNEAAVFYVDPPYHWETRKGGEYRHEMTDEHYQRLVETLLNVKGAVVLSGYAHPVYWPLEAADWKRIDFKVTCSAAGRTRNSDLQGTGVVLQKAPRIESVWLNQKAQSYAGR